MRHLLDGYEQLAALGEHAFASTVAAGLAMTHLRLGRLEEVEPWLATARDLCPPGDIATLTKTDLGEGLLHARRGSLDEAERLIRRGFEQAEATDFWEFRGEANEALAEVFAARGRREEACAALEQAAGVYREKGARLAEGRARALLAEL